MQTKRMVPVSDGALLLPEVLALTTQQDHVELSLMIHASLPCFDGHFDGFPLVPGVVQIGWAIAFSSRYLFSSTHIKSVEKLKFTHPIQPGQQVTLFIKFTPDKKFIGFSYKKDDQPCSQGRVVFIDE